MLFWKSLNGKSFVDLLPDLYACHGKSKDPRSGLDDLTGNLPVTPYDDPKRYDLYKINLVWYLLIIVDN